MANSRRGHETSAIDNKEKKMSATAIGLTPALESEIAAAEAAGLKPKNERYRLIEPNEDVIGIVTSPRLIALLAMTDQKFLDFTTRWPERPDDPDELALAMPKKEELDVLRTEVWTEVFTEFGLTSENTPNAGLVRNEKGEIVVVKVEDDNPGGTVADLLATILLGTPPDALLAQLSEKCATCTDTGCPQHPNYVPAANTEMQ